MKTRLLFAVVAVLTLNSMCFAQLEEEPDGSNVDIYFPHLADGGGASYKFQTILTFVNPSSTTTANLFVQFFDDNGNALNLDFGAGPTSSFSAQIAPLGNLTLRSTGASTNINTGWAFGGADLPLQATIQFVAVVNGVAQQQVSALSTTPGESYLSPATYSTGLAFANVYVDLAVTLNISVYSANGAPAGTSQVTIPASGHKSFNLSSLFPALPKSFTGSVRVLPTVAGVYFLGYSLGVDSSGLISSYPPGAQAFPPNQVDRIYNVYYKDLNAAQFLSTGLGLGVPFNDQAVPLNILDDQILNAFALRSDDSVNIELALAELISDSPSELAFSVAHEMGHTIQYRTGKNFFVPSNVEYDADQWGMLISLIAGYDPYAAAGALAKLAMASNDASLISQQFDNISGDLHGSFDNRIALVFSAIQSLCSQSSIGSFCTDYKTLFHPHFPGNVPLSRPGQTAAPETRARQGQAAQGNR